MPQKLGARIACHDVGDGPHNARCGSCAMASELGFSTVSLGASMLCMFVKLGALFVAGAVLALLVLFVGCEVPDPFFGTMCRSTILVALAPVWERRSEPPSAAASVARSAGKPCAPRVYPEESLRAGEQGITWVHYTTGDDGAVVKVEVARSSGYARLDAAALEHVKTCKFRPGRRGTLLEKWVIYWSAR